MSYIKTAHIANTSQLATNYAATPEGQGGRGRTPAGNNSATATATGNRQHATDSRQLPVLEAVWQLLAMAMAVVAMAVHVM
jgi:hypothetical protein